MKQFQKFLLIVAMFIFAISGRAQEGWKLYKETDEIKIYYTTAICPIPKKTNGSKEKYLFKVENKTDKELWVTWNFHFWMNGRCIGCNNGDEYKREYSLAPKRAVQAGCNERKDLQVTIRMIDVPGAKSKLDKFEIENIQVSEMNSKK